MKFSRRDFIKRSGLVGAASLVLPSSSTLANETTPRYAGYNDLHEKQQKTETGEKKMITRMVLIHFKEDAPQWAYDSYEEQKKELAKLPCVKRMISGPNYVSGPEEVTRKIMSSVTYPQSLSLWEFEDEAGLEEFLTAPVHKKLAGSEFVKHVEWRYVGNIRS
jgi:hypothetical protein